MSEIDDESSACFSWEKWANQLNDENKALRQQLAEYEALRRDAERYRWLRGSGCNFVWAEIGSGNCLKGLDDAIDAAINMPANGEGGAE